MTRLEFASSDPIGHRATLGLIVLQADETIEPEFHRLVREPGVALYTTRIPSGRNVTPETLRAMAEALPVAASLFPGSLAFDVIGYACTSGATFIGSETVARKIRSAVATDNVTDPLKAVIAACGALGVRHLGFVTPYVMEVSGAMRAALEEQGLEITAFGSFEQAEENTVARIDPRSVLDAALRVGSAAACDAVFISCTNLRTLDIIATAEAQLGKPVITSNQALAWHMLRSAGIDGPGTEFGTLMATAPGE